MERINQFALYQLGQRLKLIASFTGDTPLAEIVFPIFEARESLNWLVKGPMSIGISRRSADAIFDCLGGKEALQVARGECRTRASMDVGTVQQGIDDL